VLVSQERKVSAVAVAEEPANWQPSLMYIQGYKGLLNNLGCVLATCTTQALVSMCLICYMSSTAAAVAHHSVQVMRHDSNLCWPAIPSSGMPQ